MSDLVDRGKLIRAQQHLNDSSDSYDKGCEIIRSILNETDSSVLKPFENLFREYMKTKFCSNVPDDTIIYQINHCVITVGDFKQLLGE